MCVRPPFWTEVRGWLTVLVHGEVHNLAGALPQRLDDGGEAVASAGLPDPALRAAVGPHPAQTADRPRPGNAHTHTRYRSEEPSPTASWHVVSHETVLEAPLG